MKKLLLSLLCLGMLVGCGSSNKNNNQNEKQESVKDEVSHKQKPIETKHFVTKTDGSADKISLASGKYCLVIPENGRIITNAGVMNKELSFHTVKNDNVVEVNAMSYYVFENEKEEYLKKSIHDNMKVLSEFDGVGSDEDCTYTGSWEETKVDGIDASKNTGEINVEDGRSIGKYACYTLYIDGDTSYPLYIMARVLNISNDNELISAEELDSTLKEYIETCVQEVEEENDVVPVPFRFTSNKYYKELDIYGDWNDKGTCSVSHPLGCDLVSYNSVDKLGDARNFMVHFIHGSSSEPHIADTIDKAFEKYEDSRDEEVKRMIYGLHIPDGATIDSSKMEIIDYNHKRSADSKNAQSLPIGVESGTVKYKYEGKTYTANFANSVVLALDSNNEGDVYSYYFASKDTDAGKLQVLADEICDGVYMIK